MTNSAALEQTIAALVIAYSARVRGSVLAQHDRASVHSPLGVWLLLCVCLSAAEGDDLVELEAVVGCSQVKARELLDAFLENVPSAIKAALVVWARAQMSIDQLGAWLNGLPAGIGRGPIPTKPAADRWASENTLGLIADFPIDPEQFDLLLVSALATRVSWETPYEVSASAARFSPSSPWIGVVERVLWTDRPWHSAIVKTAAAGIVAVHQAVAKEDLVVICVAADPAVPRAQVLAGAHEVNEYLEDKSRNEGYSLFDLPLGPGHSWTIEEREREASRAGQRFQRISDVVIPAWEIHSQLDLMDSPGFGATVALRVMHNLIGDGPSDARQVALARFDRYGFKAAALTVFATRASRTIANEIGIERTASLRFDHPFAALAVCGKPGTQASRFAGLPVFEAWIDTPTEVPVPRRATPDTDRHQPGAVRRIVILLNRFKRERLPTTTASCRPGKSTSLAAASPKRSDACWTSAYRDMREVRNQQPLHLSGLELGEATRVGAAFRDGDRGAKCIGDTVKNVRGEGLAGI
jgi:hypothetical protein